MIDGRVVVAGGRVLGLDEAVLARELQAAAERLWTRVPARDWAGRPVDGISPPSLPAWRES